MIMKNENQLCNENVSNSFTFIKETQGFYSFFDKKSRTYLPPFMAKSEDEAVRQATSASNYTNSLISKFPNDYALFFIGEFDEKEGIIIAKDNPVFICECFDLKQKDTICYDELLREIERQKVQVASIISDYERIHSDYKRELSVLESKKINCDDAPVQIYEPVKSKEKPILKKSFIDKLFS